MDIFSPKPRRFVNVKKLEEGVYKPYKPLVLEEDDAVPGVYEVKKPWWKRIFPCLSR